VTNSKLVHVTRALDGHGEQLAAVWEVHVLVTCATVAWKYGQIIFIKYLFVKKKVKYILDQH
jgi:hypothetical protein